MITPMSYLEPEDRLLVIIGPSGVGKTSALRLLHDQGVVEVTPSWTTRPPREDETDGTLEHTFVDEATFTQKADEGYFLDTAQLFDLPYWYGLPRLKKPEGSRVATVMLQASLLPLMDKHYKNYTIYQIEDEERKITQRLQEREAAGHSMGSRLDEYKQETAAGRERTDRVFTNDGTLEVLAGRIAEALIEDRLVGPETPQS
jgi:guanylate kinase